MKTIYTVGYTKKSLEQFIRLLQEAGVDAVVDVRLRNTSQLAGFSKRDDLAFLLREGFGIEYEHRPDLAPTPEILDAYRDEGDWAVYEAAFSRLLEERQSEVVGREVLGRYRRPCLLCAEPAADKCHRRLVAEWWAGHLPGVEVEHLD
ncbi:MAG TPA: DUF488 domain-containing protein [Chromatiales bacterium]|nr:DUF488 domain-containing protein [Chromatiales bacterium]